MSYGTSPYGVTPYGADEPSADGSVSCIATSVGSVATSVIASALVAGLISCASTSTAQADGYDAFGARARASSSASAVGTTKNDPHWVDVVFLSHCDKQLGTNKAVDEKGHTLVHGVGDSATYCKTSPDAGAIGGYYLRAAEAIAGEVTFVDGFSSDFDGFKKSDSWTVEFRASFLGPITIQGTNSSEHPFRVEFLNQGGGFFSLKVHPSAQATPYVSDAFSHSSSVWSSYCVESDGTNLWAYRNGVPLTLTANTEYNEFSGGVSNALTLGGYSKTGSGSGRFDEIRITKASRYGGTHPAHPWPFFDGREGWSGRGDATGSSETGATGLLVPVGESVVTIAAGSSATAVGSWIDMPMPVRGVSAGGSASAWSTKHIAGAGFICSAYSTGVAYAQRLTASVYTQACTSVSTASTGLMMPGSGRAAASATAFAASLSASSTEFRSAPSAMATGVAAAVCSTNFTTRCVAAAEGVSPANYFAGVLYARTAPLSMRVKPTTDGGMHVRT